MGGVRAVFEGRRGADGLFPRLMEAEELMGEEEGEGGRGLWERVGVEGGLSCEQMEGKG